MYKYMKPIFFKAVSGIHAGTGSDLGLVDLPIQRERHTGLPKIESSGIKGCVREEFEQLEKSKKPDERLETNDFVKVAFGPGDDDKNADKHAGAIAFTDARLLLFPVRSAKGIFAYATCPYIINRLVEDLSIEGLSWDDEVKCLSGLGDIEKALASSDKILLPKPKDEDNYYVVLEEFSIKTETSPFAKVLAEKISNWLGLSEYQETLLKNNLIILPNDYFNDFAQNNTEIITRTKIDSERGTVVGGALFTEEFLPAETLLYSLVMASSIFLCDEERKNSETVKAANTYECEGKYLLDQIAEKLPKYIQIGGDATIGKGLCRVNVGCVR